MPEIIQLAEHGIPNISSAQEFVTGQDAHLADTETAIDYSVGQGAEKVFTYAHCNGQEFSGTLEQARELCPVIGQMAVEKAVATLQDGDLAARLAQRGREKRQAESAKASESKERPQLLVDSKKLQEKSALKVESQTEPSVDPRNDDPSRDIASEALAADMHRSFIAQQEAYKTETTIADIRHEAPAPQLAHAANMHEAVPESVDSEPVLTANRATFINTEVALLADDSDSAEIVHEAVPQSPNKQLYESTQAQPEPEVVLRNLVEAVDPTELSESVMEHDLLEEDDVILLMAALGQSRALIEENGELPVVEISAETEVPKFTPAEIQVVASVPELPAPVEEIEVAITGLTETLELAEADESQVVHQILQEIITLPDALVTSTVEAEAAVEEKLEVLFIKLFEETGTLYTPELVASFVKLTQAHYLKELLPVAVETKDDTGALPHEIGTREFLQKLHHGLSAMKQAAIHFYEIGKSVVRLYGLAGGVPEFAV